MNRLALFARTLSLGLATVALPAFAKTREPKHDENLRGYTDARAAIKDGMESEWSLAYGWEGESKEYRTGWLLAVNRHNQEQALRP